MNPALSHFANRLRGLIEAHDFLASDTALPGQFPTLALELFALQFQSNAAYQSLCRARQLTPANVVDWNQIPAVPTGAFKELELTAVPPGERTAVFHSSGTTGQKPSRHFHGAESLALYEASLARWFETRYTAEAEFLFLTPDSRQAPHSSLVHMFDTVRRRFDLPETVFCARVASDSAWEQNFDVITQRLTQAMAASQPVEMLGTAFSFVHLVDYLAEKKIFLRLPLGSRVMETGGYKNRSRSLPKTELHQLIQKFLGVKNILCEYGMSELSSQAYDTAVRVETGKPGIIKCFALPPWAKAQVISPETGREVAEGETGILRIFDLANVFSVQAIQTEDLAIRRGEHFELIGRTQLAEPRGCSLMTA